MIGITMIGKGKFLQRGSMALKVAVLVTGGVLLFSAEGCSQSKQAVPEEESASAPEESAMPLKNRLPACWKIELIKEEGEAGSGRSWVSGGELPNVIKLDTSEVETGSAEKARRAVSYGGIPGRSFSVWRFVENDSVRIQEKGALDGIMIQVAPTGESLSGSVIGFKDVTGLEKGRSLASGDMKRRAPIEGMPAKCP
ncbi:hypothetical protein [Salinibacter sp.]|jgi:hypothetical protein|uniref:hypothetical protein n=1 Tax=Salinibacter sp. TaxID=2065818 RepID=UPI0021E787EA|nr:hypothetical protein [Salinibacter sp.]